MVTAAVNLRSPRIKETKVRETCHIPVEQLLADNMPPAVGRHCFAPCSHAGGLAAAYGLTDRTWVQVAVGTVGTRHFPVYLKWSLCRFTYCMCSFESNVA